MPSNESIKAALNAIVALTEAIRELGEVPSGKLYASVMGHMDLETYQSFIDRIKGTGLVEERSNLLVWVGPNIEN